MKGTTLTELNKRYDLQAMALADRQHPIDSEDSMPFFRAHLRQKKKLMPRGKVMVKLMKIQCAFIKYRKSEEYLQKKIDEHNAKSQREASNAGN
ncbi:hypothetical protein [Moellerella wisconsensis]|uniref:Uncharacterized protein n=2 Tax=Moellerella wisconsensis TaxID=158849 RepID=A0ACD3Y9W3_9GAMM|nr:hypothetical protein [Moellerella wisconsensis]UNH39952.1 hypothetical protein MNY70_05780 [Moellerella wisconsensis]